MQRRRLVAPAVEHLDHAAQAAACLRLQFVGLDHRAHRIEQRHLALAGVVMQQLDRGVAEPALRHVDDALEGEIIGRRVDDAQVRQRVADFGALVEPGTADHAIGQAEGDEAIFELAHLERGAHQNRDLVQRLALALQLLDLLADATSLFFRIPRAGHRDLLAVDVLGAQRLAEPAFIVRDQIRGGGEDVAGGAVVALEPDDLCAGKVVLEAQDVVDLGAAPAVDRLIVVADAADVFDVGLWGLRRRWGLALRDARALPELLRVRGEGGVCSTLIRVAGSLLILRSRVQRGVSKDEATGTAALRESAPGTRAAARDTARRWCPDIRRPG